MMVEDWTVFQRQYITYSINNQSSKYTSVRSLILMSTQMIIYIIIIIIIIIHMLCAIAGQLEPRPYGSQNQISYINTLKHCTLKVYNLFNHLDFSLSS